MYGLSQVTFNTCHNDHVHVLKFSGGDAKEGEKHGEATDDDHYVGGMDEIVGVQEATRLVRLGVSYEPYADAEDGSAEHLQQHQTG